MSHINNPAKKGFQTLRDEEGQYENQYQNYHTQQTRGYSDYAYNQQQYEVSPPSEKAKKRRCCCCCCQSRASKISCCIILLLILAGIGVAAYFCWPRGVPKVEFQDAKFTDINGVQNQLSSFTRLQDINVKIPVNLNLYVENPNLIGIKMKNITVVGKYHVGNQDVNVGNGALLQPVSFKAKGTTNFTLPFTLVYNATEQGSSQALLDLFGKCGFLSNVAKEKINIKYEATLDISLISWLGIKPTISNTVSLDCPIDPSTLPNIKTAIDGILGGK
ncbi:hypothetical protein K493DRAFT_317731 [Basidiobolus meristosporus CBS 931.73]|uniref:Late embryogenesis abundant protein LEA-2 subgroup domain-containing protein n=1 Tax=Basidiobolus meristosporus CBS 931.73 TaxID=1314790 RepID=A0A1Y1XYF2_9FUNG|nr:hypothetical protein K493DRAFT_317731 [Basidiobolus meristosporus CBS 931.73]|eukprot:ORX90778.1 hypothetical protein K493DRAFT_317731 [Basidiobolus meristosporus CBS 931.73]